MLSLQTASKTKTLKRTKAERITVPHRKLYQENLKFCFPFLHSVSKIVEQSVMNTSSNKRQCQNSGSW